MTQRDQNKKHLGKSEDSDHEKSPLSLSSEISYHVFFQRQYCQDAACSLLNPVPWGCCQLLLVAHASDLSSSHPNFFFCLPLGKPFMSRRLTAVQLPVPFHRQGRI